MGLFKRKKEVEVVDTRTDVEKKFEEKGQELGAKTGTVVQKGLNKFEQVKSKIKEEGTLDKIKDYSNKVDDKLDKFVDKVAKKGKDIKEKVVKKKKEKDFYE